MDKASAPLRVRKQRRTRESIVEAAMGLFAERGFDGVTVTDIAERAEVGRTTFFRYFTDKQEVLFDGEEELRRLLLSESEQAAAELAPLGTSLASALLVARAGLLALTHRITERSRWLALRQKLMDAHPELRARNLLKEQAYAEEGIEVMVRHGAAPETAALAASLAAACFAAAHAQTIATGRPLPAALDDAFRRLAALDGPALRSRLG
jgi:AcrR family transcriptional regulator